MAKEYTKIRFTLHMEPPRATAQGKRINRKTGAVFHTPEYQAAEAEYLLRLRQEYAIYVKDKPLPFDGPVSCLITFCFCSRYRRDDEQPKPTRPDLDNMAKCLLDCMTKVGFWFDDSQVCFLLLEKKWKTGEGFIDIEINDYVPDGGEKKMTSTALQKNRNGDRRMTSVVNDGWISVNDRLPEKEALAVCMDPRSPSYKEKLFGRICYSEEEQRFFCVYEYIYLFDVTHWRDDPLPDLPDGGETR